MDDNARTQKHLISELGQLRQRVAEFEAKTVRLAQHYEALFAQAIGSGQANIFCLDIPSGEFIASAPAKALHGLPVDVSVDFTTVMAKVHPEDLPRVEAAWKRCIERGEHYLMEYRVLKPDGGLRWIAAQAQPLPGPRGLKLVGMCQDITERKQAEEEVRRSKESLEEKVQVRTAALKQSEEQLRHLSTRLLAAQEDERKLISMDLHDSIAASLSAIKMKLQRLTPERDEPVDVQKSLQEAVRIIDGAVAEVRRIMVNLRPSMLDDLGVLPTIKHHCREFHKLHPTCRISTALDITEGEIPEPLKIVVFRVLQEALTNVGKHSQAMHVKVSLGKEDGQITLTVADNGCGFALQSAAVSSKHGKRFGLSSMHERVRLSGGSFVLQSSRGKGTLLRACWPQGELE